MPKILFLILIFFTGAVLFSTEQLFDPKNPMNHWSYAKIKELNHKGLLKGYQVEKFEENVPMTRQEIAVVLSSLLEKMEFTSENMDSSTLNTIERLIREYSHELESLNIENNRQENQIDSIQKKIQTLKKEIDSLQTYKTKNLGMEIRHSGELKSSTGVRRYRNEKSGNNLETTFELIMNLQVDINPQIQSFFKLQSISFPGGRRGNEDPYLLGYSALNNRPMGDGIFNSRFQADKAYLLLKDIITIDSITLGRQMMKTGNSLVLGATADGIKFLEDIDAVQLELSLFDSNDPSGMYNDIYNPATPSLEMRTENGLDSFLLRAGYYFGINRDSHVEAYYLKQSYEAFDPYFGLGDSFAGNTLAGNSLPQQADPNWLGIAAKGSIGNHVEVFGELVRFDPDLANDGRGPLGTGTSGTNDLSDGVAWMMGMNYKVDSSLELTLQYGMGDEEFIASQIQADSSFNGIEGRQNAYIGLNPSNSGYYALPTFSLTGVKDFMAKINYNINKLTKAEFVLEDVTDNETAPERAIVRSSLLDGLQTGAANSSLDLLRRSNSYRKYELSVQHQYSENMLLSLVYKNITYDDSSLDKAHDFDTNTRDFGGWSNVKAELEVKF